LSIQNACKKFGTVYFRGQFCVLPLLHVVVNRHWDLGGQCYTKELSVILTAAAQLRDSNPATYLTTDRRANHLATSHPHLARPSLKLRLMRPGAEEELSLPPPPPTLDQWEGSKRHTRTLHQFG
jgi:hypothetical protein